MMMDDCNSPVTLLLEVYKNSFFVVYNPLMSRVRLARNEEKIAFTLLHNHDKEMFSCNGNVDDFWFSE